MAGGQGLRGTKHNMRSLSMKASEDEGFMDIHLYPSLLTLPGSYPVTIHPCFFPNYSFVWGCFVSNENPLIPQSPLHLGMVTLHESVNSVYLEF